MTNLSERLTTVRASKVNCECRKEKKKRKEKRDSDRRDDRERNICQSRLVVLIRAIKKEDMVMGWGRHKERNQEENCHRSFKIL